MMIERIYFSKNLVSDVTGMKWTMAQATELCFFAKTSVLPIKCTIISRNESLASLSIVLSGFEQDERGDLYGIVSPPLELSADVDLDALKFVPTFSRIESDDPEQEHKMMITKVTVIDAS